MWEKSFTDEINKLAKRDMPSFTSQDRPNKVKEIYKALKREHPNMPAGKKARIAEGTYNKMKKSAGIKLTKIKLPKLPSTGITNKVTKLDKLIPQVPLKLESGAGIVL